MHDVFGGGGHETGAAERAGGAQAIGARAGSAKLEGPSGRVQQTYPRAQPTERRHRSHAGGAAGGGGGDRAGKELAKHNQRGAGAATARGGGGAEGEGTD